MTRLPYTVELTRNRNSRAVLRDDAVIVRLAHGLSPSKKKEHIDILLRRLVKAHAKQVSRSVIDPFRPLLEGKTHLTLQLATGSGVTMRVQAGSRTKANYADGIWQIERSAKSDSRKFHRFLWRVLCSDASPDIDALVREINADTFCSPLKRISVKFMRSRWGSCSMSGSISLAAPLLFTTPAILRYVIIHELAHTVHPDHSARFWKAVETHDTDYHTDIRAMKAFRMPRI